MAITIEQPRPVTDEDLLELSRLNPGYEFERDAAGELIVTPTGSEAGLRSARPTQQLANCAGRDAEGSYSTPRPGFTYLEERPTRPDAS